MANRAPGPIMSPAEATRRMRIAIELQGHGRHGEALGHYQAILDHYPSHPDLLLNAGSALVALSRPEEAEHYLVRALQLRPTSAAIRSALVKLWVRMDRDATLAELAANPAWTGAIDDIAAASLARWFLHRGQPDQAWSALAERAGWAEADGAIRHAAGLALHRLNRLDEAEAALRAALAQAPDDPAMLADLAALLRSQHMRSKRAGLVDEAAALLTRAQAIAPDNADIGHQIALAEEERGRFDAAALAYAAILDRSPGHVPTMTSLLSIRRTDPPEDLADALERALDEAPSRHAPTDRSRAHAVLGKYRDGRGEHARAFTHFDRAKALAPNPMPYDRAAQERYVAELIASYPVRSGKEDGGADDRRPLFIVGMPRSGTTLLEAILAAHPAIAGAGELAFFPAIELQGRSLHGDDGARIADRHGEAGEDHRASLRADYAAILQSAGADARHVIDKMPFNFWQVGAIKAVLPAARILWCRRDPRDVGLSCFMESFSELHGWSLTLGDIAHYMAQHDRIMAHWQALYPDDVLAVGYEDVVADFAGVASSLLAWLGLPWDDAVLSYAQGDRLIQTPSNWQVRQPIYGGSIGRWRNYRDWLGPLLDGLAPTRS